MRPRSYLDRVYRSPRELSSRDLTLTPPPKLIYSAAMLEMTTQEGGYDRRNHDEQALPCLCVNLERWLQA
jgi:hypothetical protein